MSDSVSKNDTQFIKILLLVLLLGVSDGLTGCAEHSAYKISETTTEKQNILNGTAVVETNPLAKKVLYLATGAKLLKTPTGGFTASQTGLCTATALAPKIILTAAHCVKAIDPKDDQTADSVFIILGTKPWKSKFDTKLWYAAQKIIVHPGYKKNNEGGSPDDIAIIQLKMALPLENITDIALPKDVSSTLDFTLAGYGMRSNFVTLTDAQTQENLGELFSLTKTIINYDINNLTIEIDQHDEKGICSGDSGGPGLIYNSTTKKYSTIGVVSGNRWLIEDKQSLDPQNKKDCFGIAVYTNIMNPGYYDWIQKTIQSLSKN